MSKVTLILLAAWLALGAGGWLMGRNGGTWRAVPGVALALLAVLCLASAAYSFWYHHRRQPAPCRETLFEGVTYVREVRASPRPMVVHVVTIDLDAPGVGLLVTPPDHPETGELAARTTSHFLRESGVQVAINANFFHPWYAHGPLWYYPHVGDPVQVDGPAASGGTAYGEERAGYGALSIAADGGVAIGPMPGAVRCAVSGSPLLLEGGQIPDSVRAGRPHPRTAVALDASGRRLLLVVVDGRQPNYSEGATLHELADIIREHGGHAALNLDGGGSTTLVVEGEDGEPRVLNCPIHGRVPPAVERPVANHLGVFATRR